MTIVLNPGSGTGANRDVETALGVLKAAGARLRIAMVSGKEGPGALASEAIRRGEDVVVAAGGDGTVGAVASAVTGTAAALGVLPFGTLNHFAKDNGIPLDAEEAARVLLRGNIASVDAGEVNGRVFVNNSSLGLYADLVLRRTAEQRRGKGKWQGLVHACLDVFRRFPYLHVRLQMDGREIERATPFVFVGNNEYDVEGFDLGARPRLDSGSLWVYAAPHGATRLDLARFACRALAGRLSGERDFQPLRARELVVETRRRSLPVALDGEVVRMESPLRYRSLPGALRVLVPE